jgi:hypothetical protein
MAKKPKVPSRDANKMSAAELREAGVPYFVVPDDLTVLGLDPDQYRRAMGPGMGAVVLDRVNDAELIHRLSTRRDLPLSGSLH